MNAAGCRSPPWPSNGTRGGGGAVQCTHSTVQCTLWLPPYKRPGAIRPTSRDVGGGGGWGVLEMAAKAEGQVPACGPTLEVVPNWDRNEWVA